MAKIAPIRDIDRGWRKLLDRLAKGKTKITVGVHSQDGDVTKKGAGSGVRLIDVAAVHEFGLGVPRRSFIADWYDEALSEHKEQIRKMARSVVKGSVPDAVTAADRLGNLWVAEVQKRMVAGISPPLKPETIKRKQSSTPLIDTGQLKSSIAYAVQGKLHPSRASEQAARKRIADKKKAAAEKSKARKKSALSAVRNVEKSAKKLSGSAIKSVKKASKKAMVVTAKAVKRRLKASNKGRSKRSSKVKTTKP